MAKQAYVYSGTDWVPLASEVTNLSGYYTKGEIDILDAPTGLKLIVPTSVAVGSGTGSVGTKGTVTVSGASTISLNGVFSATYDHYLIWTSMTNSGQVNMTMRYRVAGTDNTTSNYQFGVGIKTLYDATWANDGQGLTATSQPIGYNSTDASLNVRLYNPFKTQLTKFTSEFVATAAGSGVTYYHSGLFNATTSFDGFSLIPSSGTSTGTIQVYGYTK
jgi:hypothetical protein